MDLAEDHHAIVVFGKIPVTCDPMVAYQQH